MQSTNKRLRLFSRWCEALGEPQMYANWISRSNLIAWIEVLSGIAGYDLSSWDRDAFEAGIADTDSDQDRWFEHKLVARSTLDIKVAIDVGTEVLLVRVGCPRDLESRIDTATEIAKEYRLVKDKRV